MFEKMNRSADVSDLAAKAVEGDSEIDNKTGFQPLRLEIHCIQVQV